MNREPSVASSSVRAVVNSLTRYQVPAFQIERILGIPLSDLEDLDLRVPISRYHQLWQRAIESSGKQSLGLELGEQVDPQQMGVIGHIVLNSESIGEGIRQYARFIKVVNEGISIAFKVEGEIAKLIFIFEDPSYYCIPDMERTLALAISRARNFVDSNLRVEQVWFQHAVPTYADEYQRIFRCPVAFEMQHTAILFKAKLLDHPLTKRNPYLHSVLMRHADKLLSKIFKRSFASKVKSLISENLNSGLVDAEQVAKQLYMSRNTLYRKLKQEGQSFQGLVEEVRQELAKDYLQNYNYSLSEIAFLLGFSELSAFSRAFKRWMGVSPKAYRSKNKPEANGR